MVPMHGLNQLNGEKSHICLIIYKKWDGYRGNDPGRGGLLEDLLLLDMGDWQNRETVSTHPKHS